MKKDLWVIWHDDFMVPIEELDEFKHRSDIYDVVEVLEYVHFEEGYYPSKWVPYNANQATNS